MYHPYGKLLIINSREQFDLFIPDYRLDGKALISAANIKVPIPTIAYQCPDCEKYHMMMHAELAIIAIVKNEPLRIDLVPQEDYYTHLEAWCEQVSGILKELKAVN